MKKGLKVLLILSLVFTLIPVWGAQASETASFIVVFNDSQLTDEARQAVLDAGGTVTYEVIELGILEATTDQPTSFIKAMLANSSVNSLAPSIELPLNLPVDSAESEDIPDGLAPVPAGESIWESLLASELVL